ncbi:integrase core domain-containing protein [Streptomyces sp. NPDC001933]|uniref:integrase core domain-containing protein n=1 Tax=Streptomyces sp. NPDC001933 TaxID=3364626 RepID=UPI00368A7638
MKSFEHQEALLLQPCVFVWQESNSVARSCDCLAHLYRNAADHGERVRRHPSDMTDEEWTAVREQLPAEIVVGAAVGPVLAVLRDQHAPVARPSGVRPEEPCRSAPVRQSMSAVGSSADNAAAESFNATFKRETLKGRKGWSNENEARLDAFRWLSRHNMRRRHSRLGQRSPITYENTFHSTATTLTRAA